jgi:hypothetical protein
MRTIKNQNTSSPENDGKGEAKQKTASGYSPHDSEKQRGEENRLIRK